MPRPTSALFPTTPAAAMCFAAVVCTALVAERGRAENLIVNGSFETPVATNGIIKVLASGSAPLGFDWTVAAGGVEITRQGYVGGSGGSSPFNGPAYQGSQWLDLDAEQTPGPGTLLQTFATIAGSAYDLTFAYASNPYRAYPGPARATVRVFDTTSTTDLLTAFQISHGSSTGSNYDWKVNAPVTFTATGASTTLRFASDNPLNSDAGIFLDGISVTAAVPEPAGYATIGVAATVALAVRRAKPRLR
jgi:hypothetical protein